jgi:hypothetical protein
MAGFHRAEAKSCIKAPNENSRSQNISAENSEEEKESGEQDANPDDSM